MIEEDVRQSNEVAEEIGFKILNSRKVNVKDEDIPGSKAVSKNTLKNQMGFEIRNKDLNGRSIVHRAAFDQQHNQMNEVISALKSMPLEDM